jgi:serine/threonine-protein kinase
MDLDHLRRIVASSAEEAELPSSMLVGRYHLDREIARGGMGVVYRAWDPELRRAVAIKLIKDDDAHAASRLRREAQTAAALRHPNIVGVYEVGESDGRPFIAMDFIDGPTLRQALPSMNARRAVEILEQVALAVHHAHGARIVHRDLKPENILIDPTGRPVVTDFGLARVEGGHRLTSSGVAVGTPLYMAPEQVLGEVERIGPRTDVYSIGVMLYEALAGAVPYQGLTAAEIFMKIVDGEAPRPSQSRARVDRDLETIALMAMAPEPEQRYGSAQALAADLRRWLNGEPIVARPESALAKVVRRAKRHPVAAGLAAALVLAVVVGGGLAWSAFTSQRRLADTVQAIELLADQALERYEASLMGPPRPLDVERARLRDALDQLLRLYRDNPGAHEALVAIGRIHAALRDYPDAERCMDDGLTRLGSRATARHYLERAILRASQRLDWSFAMSAYSSGTWGSRPELVAGALDDFDRALALGLDPSSPRARYGQLLVAHISDRSPGTSRILLDPFPVTVQADLLRIDGYSSLERDVVRAMSSFDQAARIKESDPSVLFGVAFVRLHAKRDIPRAVDALRKVLILRPGLVDARYLLAHAQSILAEENLERTVDPTPHLDEAEAILGGLPPSADALATRAHVRITRGKWLAQTRLEGRPELDAAVADAREALRLVPGHPHARRMAAMASLILADVDSSRGVAHATAAIEAYESLLRESPRDRTLRLNLGLSYRRRAQVSEDAHVRPEDYDRAMEVLREAVREEPRDAVAREHLAMSLLSRGLWIGRTRRGEWLPDVRAAAAEYGEAVECDGTRGSAFHWRGTARLILGQMDRDAEAIRAAVADFRKAVELAPRDPAGWCGLGDGLGAVGDWKGAVRAYEKAIELRPSLRSSYGAALEEAKRRAGP